MADQLNPLKFVIAPHVEALRRLPVDARKNSLPAGADQLDQRRQQAVLHTALLLGGFRKSDADDPEVYSRVIEHTLARYDVDIQREAADAAKWKYPPTAYELRERCETLANERARAKERQERIAQQIEERRQLDAPQTECKPLPYQPREIPVRLTRDELEQRRAQQFLDRCKAEAEATAKPAAAQSVFELDPAEWDA